MEELVRQELKAGAWRQELTQYHLLRRGIAHSGLDSFTSIISPKKKMPHKQFPQVNLMQVIPQLISSSQATGFCWADKN